MAYRLAPSPRCCSEYAPAPSPSQATRESHATHRRLRLRALRPLRGPRQRRAASTPPTARRDPYEIRAAATRNSCRRRRPQLSHGQGLRPRSARSRRSPLRFIAHCPSLGVASRPTISGQVSTPDPEIATLTPRPGPMSSADEAEGRMQQNAEKTGSGNSNATRQRTQVKPRNTKTARQRSRGLRPRNRLRRSSRHHFKFSPNGRGRPGSERPILAEVLSRF